MRGKERIGFEKISSNINVQRVETIHSSELQEVMSSVPVWILRVGVLLFTIIIASVLAMSFIIKLPETIDAKLKVTSGSIGIDGLTQKTEKSASNIFAVMLSKKTIHRIVPGQKVSIGLIDRSSLNVNFFEGKIYLLREGKSTRDSVMTKIILSAGLNMHQLPTGLKAGDTINVKIKIGNESLINRLYNKILHSSLLREI
jgi:hypothetical protein